MLFMKNVSWEAQLDSLVSIDYSGALRAKKNLFNHASKNFWYKQNRPYFRPTEVKCHTSW